MDFTDTIAIAIAAALVLDTLSLLLYVCFYASLRFVFKTRPRVAKEIINH